MNTHIQVRKVMATPESAVYREEGLMTSGNISEIIFEVNEDEVDGGYSASALGYGIHTEGESVEELRRNVREAVECYFDETMKRPGIIRLHFVRD